MQAHSVPLGDVSTLANTRQHLPSAHLFVVATDSEPLFDAFNAQETELEPEGMDS